ncbi:MAG: hypothetical protein KGL12_12010 [Rhodospirillales bacterium]|nr:hypothetical protein [Rhodospirillales bacterium]
MDGPAQSQIPAALRPLLRQFLAWVAARPRRYGETMEAWRSSCPRDPVWEDALTEGLVALRPDPATGMAGAHVELTEAGEAALTAA